MKSVNRFSRTIAHVTQFSTFMKSFASNFGDGFAEHSAHCTLSLNSSQSYRLPEGHRSCIRVTHNMEQLMASSRRRSGFAQSIGSSLAVAAVGHCNLSLTAAEYRAAHLHSPLPAVDH